MSTPREGGPVAGYPYEIPLTGPGVAPFGAPGTAGATLPPPVMQQPEPPGPTAVDYSQLPPPAVAAVDSMSAPAPQPPAPSVPARPRVPGLTMPEDLPGYTPATTAGVIPIPSFDAPEPEFQILPPRRDESGEPGPPLFVADEFTTAARARVDTELLQAMEAVVNAKASDLHVSAGSPPMIRIDGALRPIPGIGAWDRERTAAALYSLMSDEQRARFDDVLELDFAFTLSGDARFRVNYYLQRGAIGGAFRLIPTEIKQLGQLGVPPIVAEFAKLPRGLVLVTGPTGSGKSTTLAALIDLVNSTRADHIVTVEDPIEFMHSNKKSLINQREVGEDTQSFANALKHVLRQDPDVILIGELRDLETISVALTAAETGHLVFATLHTQDAGQTIDRVIDVFPPHQQGQVRTQLAATLQGVVCQTLVKKPAGGRAVATEVLFTTPAIANLIREGKTYQIGSMLQSGSAHGMHTRDQHLAELVNDGTVAYEAALEKVTDPEIFNRLVTRRDLNADPTRGARAF